MHILVMKIVFTWSIEHNYSNAGNDSMTSHTTIIFRTTYDMVDLLYIYFNNRCNMQCLMEKKEFDKHKSLTSEFKYTDRNVKLLFVGIYVIQVIDVLSNIDFCVSNRRMCVFLYPPLVVTLEEELFFEKINLTLLDSLYLRYRMGLA